MKTNECGGGGDDRRGGRGGGSEWCRRYRLPRWGGRAKSQKPDGAVAGSTKRLASRFYQIKTGHCLTGQYLNWTNNRSTPQCLWCQYPNQRREHLFKVVGKEEEAGRRQT